MVKRRRMSSVMVTALVLVAMMAIPSHGITTWRTPAKVTSKGTAESGTMAMAAVSFTKPHAVRVGVATPKGVSRRVDVMWMATCEKRQKEGDKRVTTKDDGTVTWVTLYDGSVNLGSFCDVMLLGGVNNGTQLRALIQYKAQ